MDLDNHILAEVVAVRCSHIVVVVFIWAHQLGSGCLVLEEVSYGCPYP